MTENEHTERVEQPAERVQHHPELEQHPDETPSPFEERYRPAGPAHDDGELQEARLEVRELRPDDFEAVVRLQQRCFPDMIPWPQKMFESQIRIFPEGQIGVELDGELVAASSSLIVNSNQLRDRHTFNDACDKGYIRNHDPSGDSLYGIDIVVDPDHRGQRLGRRIYDERKWLIKERNLRRMLIAGRIPGYHRYRDELTPEQYVRKVMDKEILDPVITAQLANDFAIRSVLKGYLTEDKESCGHAVLMQWINPDYVPAGNESIGTVRVAAVQYQMRRIESFEEFCTQCEFFVDAAGDYNSDFLLFPELLTNQLLPLVPGDRPGLTARRLSEFTDRYTDFFQSMALKYDLNIIAGSHMTVEGDRLFNIAYLFHRDGRIDRQYKIHITPSEAHWWGVSEGDRIEAFETDCGPISIAICYDVEFPEVGRIATAKGAQILFIPFNTDLRSGFMRVRMCAQARAIENGIYCVIAGAVGNLPSVEGADVHYAQTAILTPSDIAFARDGVAAEATPGVETMLVQDLDIDALRRNRYTGSVRTWLDRRPDLYRVTWTEEGTDHSV